MKMLTDYIGFTLKEIILIIAIILITVYISLPQFTEIGGRDCISKNEFAHKDCSVIAEEIKKYNSLNNNFVQDTYMVEIINMEFFSFYENATTTINLLKDPWGNRYEHDYKKKIVFSKGRDGKHTFNQGRKNVFNIDDEYVSYIGALRLVDAKLEVNPYKGNYKNISDTKKCFDILHLYFNKDVAIPVNGNLDLGSNTIKENYYSTIDNDASIATFRYYEKTIHHNILAPSDLNSATNIPIQNSKNSITDFGDLSQFLNSCYAWGNDSTEIIIKYAAGYTSSNPSKKLLIAETNFINICGAKNNKNKTFYESNGSVGANAEHEDGAEQSDNPILIKILK